MNYSEAGKKGAEKSKIVKAANHAKFVDDYYKQPKKCKLCQKDISFERRRNDYCGHSCAAKYNNVKRGNKVGKIVEPHNCKLCGELTTKVTFCSIKCVNAEKHRIFIEEWLSGKRNVSTCNGMSVSVHIKRWLRKKCGNKCEKCGWSEKNPVTNKVPLQLNHKDGNPENNDSNNLDLLCPNCHSLTPNFGSLNRGNGRKMRYKKK